MTRRGLWGIVGDHDYETHMLVGWAVRWDAQEQNVQKQDKEEQNSSDAKPIKQQLAQAQIELD